MSNLPSVVRVGHVDYIVRPMTPAEVDEVGHGVHNWRDGVIKIDTTQCWQRQIETLWHEVKHAIHVNCDLGDESKEEDFCTRASPAELAFFRDNPEFVGLLRSDSRPNPNK